MDRLKEDRDALAALGTLVVDGDKCEEQVLKLLKERIVAKEKQSKENENCETLGTRNDVVVDVEQSNCELTDGFEIAGQILKQKDPSNSNVSSNKAIPGASNTQERSRGVCATSTFNFEKYLKTQTELAKKYPSKKKLKKSQKRKILDMKVIFPKKRRRKMKLGTDTVEETTMRCGDLDSEKKSFYLNYEDDSDYVPSSESDEYTLHVAQPCCSKSLRSRPRKRKASQFSEGEDEESEWDSDSEKQFSYSSKFSRMKKEQDDGNIKYYQARISKLPGIEGEMHELENGLKLPYSVWNSLYGYQKIGVRWLWDLHQQRCGGILADEMGLGKTIQIIAFLRGLQASNILFRYSNWRGLGPSLLVCPATVMHQWVKEFHTWFPSCRVAVLHESGSFSGNKTSLIQSIQQSKGVLITSYVGVVSNQNNILKHSWHYVMLDEGHKIRNPDAQVTLTVKQIATPHRLILSGSPLQNNLKELWSLFDFIYPGKLGTLPAFMEQFSVPIVQGGYSNASQIQVATAYRCAKMLRDLINPFLLRRMKCDVKESLQLPEKNEQVLFCKMTPEQRAVYINYINSREINSIVQGSGNLFVGLINLRKICNHPHLFDKNAASMITRANCVAGVKGNSTYEDLAKEESQDLDLSEVSESFGDWRKSGKMIVLETLLNLWKKQNHKVLLFTQSKQMLCILEKFVVTKGYSYLRLDGSTNIGSRQPMIKKFNESDSVFIFILTTRVGGLGINLTSANRVVLFDPDWNPSTDAQARERAWRIGQMRQVTVYRLITSGTIEEKIYHRQIFKQFLTNKVLKDPKQKRFFKMNDLMELFSFNEGTKGTESEAIFAGTNAAVSRKEIKRAEPKEKSGKFKNIPHLSKQRTFNSIDGDINEVKAQEDDYVLRKLFKKSGVEAALKHDKIVDTSDSDYMIVEKEAERVAEHAAKVLAESREQCWSAESGNVNWTGSAGTCREEKPKLRFGSKKVTPKVGEEKASSRSGSKEIKLFQGPSSSSSDGDKNKGVVGPVFSSKDILEAIRSRKQLEGGNGGLSTAVESKHMELLRDIREFIAFRAMIDGQATTDEIISEFSERLPQRDTVLFKQMLSQLCTFRKVDGRGVWRLKTEFR